MHTTTWRWYIYYIYLKTFFLLTPFLYYLLAVEGIVLGTELRHFSRRQVHRYGLGRQESHRLRGHVLTRERRGKVTTQKCKHIHTYNSHKPTSTQVYANNSIKQFVQLKCSDNYLYLFYHFIFVFVTYSLFFFGFERTRLEQMNLSNFFSTWGCQIRNKNEENAGIRCPFRSYALENGLYNLKRKKKKTVRNTISRSVVDFKQPHEPTESSPKM